MITEDAHIWVCVDLCDVSPEPQHHLATEERDAGIRGIILPLRFRQVPGDPDDVASTRFSCKYSCL